MFEYKETQVKAKRKTMAQTKDDHITIRTDKVMKEKAVKDLRGRGKTLSGTVRILLKKHENIDI